MVIQDVRGRYTSEGEWYTFKTRIRRWLRHGGVGRGAAVFQWQGRHVRRILRRCDADAHGHRASAAPCGDLSRGDRLELSRRLDLQGGAFEQWFNESWTSGLAQDTLNRKVEAATNALEASRICR